MPAEQKSLAHPEWPYAGTAHEWRGFVEARDMSVDECRAMERATADLDAEIKAALAIYQKQNLGPELT